MSSLTIVLMTRNRPILVEKAIESILNQTEKNFRFIISDNSTNLETKELVHNKFPEVEYVSRYPGVSVSEHFKMARELGKSNYLVMFHDDDILESRYVETILYTFANYPKTAAIATNGYLINEVGNIIEDSPLFVSSAKILRFESASKLLERYLSENNGRVAPFSSYAYDTNLIRSVEMDFTKGRNYFDTIFLSKIINPSSIIWLNLPLVKICHTSERITTESGVRDYKAFLQIVKKLQGINILYIIEYHIVHLYFELRLRRKYPLVAIKFLLNKSFYLLLTSKNFRIRLFNYLIKKINL
jgi:hypothetical protein